MDEGEAKDLEDVPEEEVKVLRSGKRVGDKPAEDHAQNGSNQDDVAEVDTRPVKELAKDADQLESLKISENQQGGGPQSGGQAEEATNGGIDKSEKPSSQQTSDEPQEKQEVVTAYEQEDGKASEDQERADGDAVKEVEKADPDAEKRLDEKVEKRDSRERDRERKSDRKDKGRDRERDGGSRRERSRERDRDRKDKHKDRDRDRERGRDKDGKRSREDDLGRKDSKRSRRSRSRERSRDVDKGREGKSSKRSRRSPSREKSKSRRDSRSRRGSSRERRSSRRSPSRSKRRSRSRGRRRSSSRDKHRRRSHSRGRGHRSRRRSYNSSSDEGFGGYVPRKRQEVPQAVGIANTFIDPYANLRSKQPLPTDPEGIKRALAEQQLRARQMVLQQQATSAVAAASKTQREIYVGNLVQGLVNEEALRQLFNTTMRAAFPEQQVAGLDPVVTASMHSEGRYAFVELRTPEMASAALQLSGQVQLLGQNISVGRPSGFVDPSAAQMAAAQAATALQSFELGQTSLEAATEAMNTITTGPPALSASAPPQESPMMALPPPPAGGPAGTPPAPGPTPFLQVVGMVTAEVLTDDEEYAEVIEDLQEECGKFGQLLNIVVPRPIIPAQSSQVFGQGNYGKAFVHFADPAMCNAAKNAIHGRLFAGVALQATFASEAEFNIAKTEIPSARNPTSQP